MSLKKVIVIGLDGLEPTIVEAMLAAGELPHLARLKAQGSYSRLRTTYPAQTPVAWSTFATGVNPGGHGIFDFIGRDPKTHSPTLALSRYEQKNAFLPPKAVNPRGGTPVWDVLSKAGIASTVLRCPCTYPPDNIRGRMLAGVGVPDLRGGLGTSTFYVSRRTAEAQEGENVVPVDIDADGTIATYLVGPRNPRTRSDFRVDITLHLEPQAGWLTLRSPGQPKTLEVREGEWSDWLRVKFKIGPLQSVSGMLRFYLVQLAPVFELYASPINFDPDAPLFPISSPPEYVRDLAGKLGPFHTLGMAEDDTGLKNNRFDEEAYLKQCEGVLREREAMLLHELARLSDGFLFCLFDTPDRLQHMFWRFREPHHPANNGDVTADMRRVIEEHYRACDAIVGKAMRYADDQTLFIVLSDHGMNSFQRGIHLNTWLHDNGLLALRDGVTPGPAAGDFFQHVDWGRTQAYALGLGGIYINQKGREERGIVAPDAAPRVQDAIIRGLTGLRDPARGQIAVRSVMTRQQLYSGPYAHLSPDLLVNCATGYRASWGTPLGGVPDGVFEDNIKKWGGDHCIDPHLVPGVLFMSRPTPAAQPQLADLAPTILAALGVPKAPAMEGEPLLP